MKYILFLTCLGLLFSCSSTKNNRKLTSMNVLYYNYLFERILAVRCDEIKYSPITFDTILSDPLLIEESGVIDTTIINEKYLNEVEAKLKLLKKRTYKGIDARMKCYFHYSDKSVDSLCIGQSPKVAIYNNKPVYLNNELIYLIRNYSGFYKWMIADQMIYFSELNDSSFIRKKVISKRDEVY